MRLLPLSQCLAGDRVDDAIRGGKGQVLVKRGEVLTDGWIAQLQSTALPTLPIAWPGFEEIEGEWWFPEELFQPMAKWAAAGARGFDRAALRSARGFVKHALDSFPVVGHRTFEWLPLYQGGNPALTAWMNIVALTAQLTNAIDSRWTENYTLAAVILGMEMDIAGGQLGEPDVGRLTVLMERLSQINSMPPTAHASLAQHHARWDGSGNPPIAGDAIYQGARILGIAEFLATLIFRTDAPAVAPSEALERVLGGAGIEFPLDLVQLVQRTVAPFPVGSVVTLGTGEVAVVLENPKNWPARPHIALLSGAAAGKKIALEEPGEIFRVITGLYSGREWMA